jgi:uncharacterized GH25 family protein
MPTKTVITQETRIRLFMLPAFRISLTALCGALLALPLSAHEFWIEPREFQVETFEPVEARFLNGQNFDGVELAYFETQANRFDIEQNAKSVPYTGRMGDIPAVQLPDGAQDGLLILVYESVPASLKYKTWQEFQAFADHKGFADIQEQHRARGLPDKDFFETYSRHVKTLIGVGEAAGRDRALGLQTEIVALDNPYALAGAGTMRVQVLYQGDPRSDAQLEVFDKAPDGQVTVTTQRTDANGMATVQMSPGDAYHLDSVVLRPAPDTDRSVWRSLWAGLTFAVPAAD